MAKSFDTRPLHPLFGSEILGLDLAAEMDDETLQAVKAIFARDAVCLIRQAEPLSAAAQIAFSQRLGPLNRVMTTISGAERRRLPEPEITDVSNLDADGAILEPDSRLAMFHLADRLWHTDYSFVANRATWSMLAAHVVPPEGGDTEFVDMRVAYEALPETMKRRIEGLVAEHCVWESRLKIGYPEPTEEERQSRPPVQHPLVHRHEPSGRLSLYIASHASHVVGMPEAEGKALLDELIAFSTRPELVYRHQWRYGDVVVWDNLCTMHRATPFASTQYPRDMRRTTNREFELA